MSSESPPPAVAGPFIVQVTVKSAFDLKKLDWGRDVGDPWCEVKFGTRTFKSYRISHLRTNACEWASPPQCARFYVPAGEEKHLVSFTLNNFNKFRKKTKWGSATCAIPLEGLVDGGNKK